MNIPNALTLFRVVLIPVFVWAYFNSSPVRALLIFLLAAFTDFLDGYLARKWNQITDFGKLLDPLADKLMTVTLLICLAITGNVAWWVAIVMLMKELFMLIGSLYMLSKKIVVYSNIYGKVATFAFIVALALVFPWHSVDMMTTIGNVLMYIAVALSLLSMVIYSMDAYKNLKRGKA